MSISIEQAPEGIEAASQGVQACPIHSSTARAPKPHQPHTGSLSLTNRVVLTGLLPSGFADLACRLSLAG